MGKTTKFAAFYHLVSSGVPQLVHDDEGDDAELQQEAEDAQRNVLDGNHLGRLVLEEVGAAGSQARQLGGLWTKKNWKSD